MKYKLLRDGFSIIERQYIQSSRKSFFFFLTPLASDYSFQSPYAYAANNPISFIDFMGLSPIYEADGTLIGWEAEEGEGPTQIAQKLGR